ncbi:MAG: molybdate ABC transporter substrate-binding protein [Pseudolabrys sp.]|nr:molybdate ABC transporter substrate-binding protein [Pseudolabrys sp.]
MTSPAHSETVKLYAAGSLRAALTDVAQAYSAVSGNKVETKYGASGLLKDEIVAGAPVHVFASANMEHPQALADAGKGEQPRRFARNTLCALVRPGLKVETATLLVSMLDPAIKVGTSTPKADPSGDYAFESFAKADAIKPGATAVLATKALKLTGSNDSAKAPEGRNTYGWHVAERHADIFLTYCTNAAAARAENPALQVVTLPARLSVGADYGLTVLSGAPDAARAFAEFILSPSGQTILKAHGFTPAR